MATKHARMYNFSISQLLLISQRICDAYKLKHINKKIEPISLNNV